MGELVKFSETRCGFRKRSKAYTPDMANPETLRRLRALVSNSIQYDGEPSCPTQLEIDLRQAREIRRALPPGM